ncbi:hypothetical protein V6Z12_D07G190800 [Gossypium hirsutum]
MAVYVNLGKPLISKVLINGNLQRVEYESLLVMCFFCGRYGYNNESCPHTSLPSGLSKVMDPMTGINQKIRWLEKGILALGCWKREDLDALFRNMTKLESPD